MIYEVLTQWAFEDAVKGSFSRVAAGIIYNYIDESGEDIELDVPALRGEFDEMEYAKAAEYHFADEFEDGFDDDDPNHVEELLELLMDVTEVIGHDHGIVVYRSF